jgi:hypothetical protein
MNHRHNNADAGDLKYGADVDAHRYGLLNNPTSYPVYTMRMTIKAAPSIPKLRLSFS